MGQGGSGGPQLPNVRITADLLNNSVLIYARPDEYKLIERTLMQLDRPKLQVAIDVTIAEVTLNDQLNYGVQFFLHGGAVSNTVTGTMPSIINNVASNTGSTTTGTGLSGGLNIIAGNPASPRVVINALSQLTDVKILSNPSLVVVDNGDASLEVGDQVPISTGSANVLSANNAVVNTVDYKNTGVILHVEPHVNYNGSVLLDIDQLVSEPTGPTAHPHDFERKVKSAISVVRGQTVLLAGMIQDQQQNRVRACRFSASCPSSAGRSARRARTTFAPSSSCSFDHDHPGRRRRSDGRRRASLEDAGRKKPGAYPAIHAQRRLPTSSVTAEPQGSSAGDWRGRRCRSLADRRRWRGIGLGEFRRRAGMERRRRRRACRTDARDRGHRPPPDDNSG